MEKLAQQQPNACTVNALCDEMQVYGPEVPLLFASLWAKQIIQTAPKQREGWVWKATNEKTKQVCFLVGSIHAGLAGCDALSDVEKAVLTQSRIMGFELVESRNIPTEELIQDKEDAQRHDETVEKIRQWLPLTGLSSTHGVEKRYLQHAREKQLPVLELDNPVHVSQHILAMNGIKEKPYRFITHTAEMYCAYQQRNTNWFLNDARQQEDNPKHHEILKKRNQNIADCIASISYTNISIVGLGHLIGEGNILELLQDKGFTIKRCTIKNRTL